MRQREDFSRIQNTFGSGKPRGNMGIFICPYCDCHHIADADLQAAFNIAIRGYLADKQRQIEKNGKQKTKLTKEFFCDKQAELIFEPVEL